MFTHLFQLIEIISSVQTVNKTDIEKIDELRKIVVGDFLFELSEIAKMFLRNFTFSFLSIESGDGNAFNYIE